MQERSDGKYRSAIRIGSMVDIVQKQDQKNGKMTRGIVAEILTNTSFHPHGIKVRLEDGKVGRVGVVVEENGSS
jgi:uncharacterized repeat protein (TIGR03833 family)